MQEHVEPKLPILPVDLDSYAKARFNAQTVSAKKDLEEGLIAFFETMKSGGETQLGRNPNSYDLLPYFEKCAQSILDAFVKESLPLPRSKERRKLLLRKAQEVVIDQICQKRGIWSRAINRACLAADLGSWTTEYGEYNPATFLRPRTLQLKKRLGVYAAHWEVAHWQDRATASPSLRFKVNKPSTISDTLMSGKIGECHFPNRSKWLRDRLGERNWTQVKFHEIGGPDRTTTRAILNGHAVSELTLEKVVEALSKQYAVVKLEEVPHT